MTKPDVSDLLDQVPDRAPTPKRSRFLVAAVLALLATSAVATVIGATVLRERSAQLHATLAERLELLAANRSEVAETWGEATARLGSQLVNAELFRLFATESRIARESDPLATQLSAQAPYMAQVLTEFVRQNDLQAAYLIGGDGRALIASGGAPGLTQAQRDLTARAVATGETVFAPVRLAGRELELDILRPVLEMQPADPAAAPAPAAAFLMTVPVTGVIDDFIAARPLSEDGETTRIVQYGDAAGPVMLDPRADAPLRTVAADLPAGPEPLPFGERTGLVGGAPVFSVGAAVPSLPWLMVQEIDRDEALAPLGRLRAVVAAIGALATLLVTGALVAFWSRQESKHHRALADQYRRLAARIDVQRRLLDGINGAIREYIGLKRPDGTYAY
ncbi:MAG TPA: hypothetical protein VFO41_05675, partial [Alphaproteobacteria bacterium]|nr:hypothetical protein [Alphaproteobacteria bacterium]